MFGLTRAPDFQRPGQTWFNVDAPLRLADLRGRVVILDFWTFCCVNCHHVLPTLRRIEEHFPNEVAVIGVHSPKFEAERSPESLAQAIARHDVRHPVIHDPGMTLWDEYAVRAWPTLVLISPDGHVIGQLSGEPDPDRILDGLACMIGDFMERGELRPCALPLPLRPQPAPAGRLGFPGRIRPLAAPTSDGACWALADSGHHQIVLLDDAGTELRRIGGGPDFRDGDADSAGFRSPQGLCSGRGGLYVADTGNHALRRIDPETGAVRTIAGNGGRGLPVNRPWDADHVMLASPWDVVAMGDTVYIANAGTHQILAWDAAADEIRPVAGTGAEAIVDGRGLEALLAQTSGLALDATHGRLWFVDAETSAVRALHLDDGRVETLLGRGLFVFGHADGPIAEARLQHPCDVAMVDGGLIVADSYNNALRHIDLTAGTVDTLALDTALAEPSSVCPAGPDRLLVCDTNNHRVLEVAPSSGRTRVWLA